MIKTILTCDICEKEVRSAHKLEINDGEHPHCGSTMTKNIDCCPACLQLCSLRSYDELDDIKQKYKGCFGK